MIVNGLISTLEILVFPGVLFLLLLAFFYEWIDRKMVARIQSRYGPLYTGPAGILQPFTDFLKLLFKEDITPKTADRPIFFFTPVIYLALSLTILFIIPITNKTGLVAFEGDLIFTLLLLTLMVITIFLAGWSSMSRLAGSLSISRIVEWQTFNTWMILLQPFGFGILVMCLLAELEFVPFDIPHAETEIVAGWKTEFSGRKLALFRLGKNLELVFASAFIASLYLGGAQEVWLIPPVIIFLIKTTLTVMLLSLLKSLFARFRIDQMISGMWRYLLPLAIFQVILIQVGLGG